jgi:hypothetical protein
VGQRRITVNLIYSSSVCSLKTRPSKNVEV